MTISLPALRALAEKASPGPWHAAMNAVTFGTKHMLDDGGDFVCDAPNTDYDNARWDKMAANMAYIAAASPDVILALIRRLEAADDLIGHLMICATCSESHPSRCEVGSKCLHAYDQSTADDDEGKKL